MKKTFTLWLGGLICLAIIPLASQRTNAQCAVGETEHGLLLNTVSFGPESYWELRDSQGVLIESTTAGTYATGIFYDENSFPEHKFCLENDSSYTFDAYDSFGDGWNGNTYEILSLCDGSLAANNGGLTPNNGIGGFVPNDLESSETFTVIPGFPNDIAAVAILDPASNCAGTQDVLLVICNSGSSSQTTFDYTVEVDTTTFTGSYGDTLFACGDCDTLLLGTIDLEGSTNGTPYEMNAWTSLVGDQNTANDTIANDSIWIFDNTNLSQTLVFNPGIPISNGVVEIEFYVCNANYGLLDSCTRLENVYITDITHTWDSELSISLESPQGTVIDLSSGNGGTGDNYDGVVFNDQATVPIQSQTFGVFPNTYLPETPLNTFAGEVINGVWTLIVNDGGNNGAGTINEVGLEFVDVNPSPGFTADTVCNVTAFDIDVANPHIATYDWHDGSTNPAFTVTASGLGTYSVTTTDVAGLCTSSGSFDVSLAHNVDLGPDQTICANEQVTYNLGDAFATALWDDASTGLVRTVDAVGTYTVDVTDTLGCTSADTTLIIAVLPLPQVDLGQDTLEFCAGGFQILDAGTGFTNYAWSNQSVGQQQIVATSANYIVTVTDPNGCTNSDNTEVIVNPLPNVASSLPPPAFSAPGSTQQMPLLSYPTVLWTYGSSFSTQQSIVVPVPLGGVSVNVSVTDAKGCIGTGMTYFFNYPLSVDEINDEAGFALFPNPNNGQFTLRNNGDRETVSLQVLDLTGKVVFSDMNVVMDNGVDRPISLENVAQGTYLMNIIRNDRMEQIKLIIQ